MTAWQATRDLAAGAVQVRSSGLAVASWPIADWRRWGHAAPSEEAPEEPEASDSPAPEPRIRIEAIEVRDTQSAANTLAYGGGLWAQLGARVTVRDGLSKMVD